VAAKKGNKVLLDLLNKGIAREIQVSIQYMWQHVQAIGFEGALVGPELKAIAITEMKHAEDIAERLCYLGGVPTTKPDPIKVGKTVREMIKLDIAAEEGAITLYKKILVEAKKAGHHHPPPLSGHPGRRRGAPRLPHRTAGEVVASIRPLVATTGDGRSRSPLHDTGRRP